MAILRAALLSALAFNIHVCTAHMQMSWPFPLRSPLNPATPESLKDYDMASPLRSDGSDFPCKNYQNNATNSQAFETTATYSAGSTYNITLAGGATHLGGSCQISLSYDNGATFKVIESIIGGCPLALNYDFTVPEFAPASDSALLSWSWFNLIGEQNMYQNCARVQIVGTGSPAPQVRRRTLRYESRRQTAFDALPDLFVCNVGNGCRTQERQSVVFPNPGSAVQYGQDDTDPIPGPGFILSNSTASSTSSIALPTTTSPPPFPVFNTTSAVGPTGTGFTAANFTTTSMASNTTSTTSTTSSDSTSTSASITSTTASLTTTSDSSSSTFSNLAPTQVTVTVTYTVTPTAATATPFESVTEIITIVPISELSILGVVPAGV